MKAVLFARRGGIQNLQYVETPTPTPGPDEALVRVHACGLNHLDLFTREGSHGVHAPLPHIGGLEPAGEIAALGAAVRDWRIGDRVLVGSAIVCGECEFCKSGNDNLCTRRKVIGVNVDGGFAEFIRVPASILLPVPETMSYVQAAAAPTAFGTAWHMLITRAAVQPGETVLVHAAGSNVGVAAIQIAKHRGATVIATASTAAKLAKAKELGADFVINYAEENFSHGVMRLTAGRGVDIVVEHVGTTTWEKSIASLRPLGRLVTCGSTTGRYGQTDLWSIFWKQISILGSFAMSSAEFRTVWELVRQGTFHPVIDRTFPLEETAAAQQYLADRKQFGKVVIVS